MEFVSKHLQALMKPCDADQNLRQQVFKLKSVPFDIYALCNAKALFQVELQLRE